MPEAPKTPTTVSTDQFTAIGEKIVYGIAMVLCMKAVARGWIASEDAPYYAGGAVAFIGGIYGWWVNRPKNIMIAATNAGATVITTPELAAATPNNANIVSSVAEAKEVVK
jgi:hypothetical protein